MKSKLFLFACASACLLLCDVASAKTVTYSDDYLEFNYDDSLEQIVSKESSNSFARYTREIYDSKNNKNMCSCSITFALKEEFDKNYTDDYFFKNESFENLEILSDDPLEVSYSISRNDGSTYLCRRKLIFENSDLFSFVTCSYEGSKKNDYISDMYESVSLNEDKIQDFHFSEDYFNFETIYANISFSDQMVAYAGKAIEIAQDYLDFKLSSDDAIQQIESLCDRCEEYSDQSEHRYDYLAYYEITPIMHDIKSGDDYKLMNDIENLKSFCSIE